MAQQIAPSDTDESITVIVPPTDQDSIEQGTNRLCPKAGLLLGAQVQTGKLQQAL